MWGEAQDCTYKDWFKHMRQHHNLFQQDEAWKSIATDQLQNIGGLKYCQKCHEPWNANGLARHETSCRKNIETAQTMTSEAANQAAAAVQPGDIADIGNKEVIVDWDTITPELLQEACAIGISCHTKTSAPNERVITGMLKKVYDQGLQHGEEKAIAGRILSAIGLSHDSRSFHEPDGPIPSIPQREQTHMIDMTSPGGWQRIPVQK